MSSTPSITARPTAETAAAVRQTDRNDALDWTKGALVVCMVIYHAINYSAFRPLAFQYLGFLPPSFILIAGFLVAQVYGNKYDLRTRKPYLRLLVRGAKMLALFVVLNLANFIVLERGVQEGILEFGFRSEAIFLSGNGRVAIFEVLLPIAYFLLFAPILLWLIRFSKAWVAVAATVIFGLCFVSQGTRWDSENLGLFSAGVIGMALGLIPSQNVTGFARQWLLVLLVYGVYRACSFMFGETYSVQMLAAAASILVLYCWALHLDCSTWLGQQTVLLGQYSLFAYLAQIAILKMLVKLFGRQPQHWLGVLALVALGTLLTVLCVKLLHELRKKVALVKVGYKVVFA